MGQCVQGTGQCVLGTGQCVRGMRFCTGWGSLREAQRFAGLGLRGRGTRQGAEGAGKWGWRPELRCGSGESPGQSESSVLKWNGSVSSHQPALLYRSRGSAQTPVSAPSILENNPNSHVTEAFGKASWKGINQQESWLEKGLHKLPQQPLSIELNPACPKEDVKSPKASIYPSPQCALEPEVFTDDGLLSKSDKLLDLQTQKKVKKKVTHPKIVEASRDRRKHPSSGEVLKAVICIQRYVRGWLDHRAFKRVKIKSKSHGPSLPSVVRSYRAMIARIKRRAGASDLSTPLQYFELEEWMDKKKFYETMFSKREFDKKMDRNDLPEFLRDCGYSIPAVGIQRVFQLVCPASTAAVRSIKKHQAIEMAFTLFPPLGAKVKNIITVPLPWVHPIIDGREGSKKSALSRQKSKKTDFQVSAALVTSSMREWKIKSLL
ncbi:IQ domain-containing protein M [Phaethornis superciliosus]